MGCKDLLAAHWSRLEFVGGEPGKPTGPHYFAFKLMKCWPVLYRFRPWRHMFKYGITSSSIRQKLDHWCNDFSDGLDGMTTPCFRMGGLWAQGRSPSPSCA